MLEPAVRIAVEARAIVDAHEEDTRIVHELSVCQAAARIDMAAINGRLIGWEIKTRADTLARLPSQQQAYSRVFDRVWLVADDRHVGPALAIVPTWWGVLRIVGVDDSCRLVLVRRSKLNRDVDVHSLVRLLWRAEALGELEALGLAGGLSRSARRAVWDRLADAVPSHISRAKLQERVRGLLKEREGWRVDRQRTSGDGSS